MHHPLLEYLSMKMIYFVVDDSLRLSLPTLTHVCIVGEPRLWHYPWNFKRPIPFQLAQGLCTHSKASIFEVTPNKLSLCRLPTITIHKLLIDPLLLNVMACYTPSPEPRTQIIVKFMLGCTTFIFSTNITSQSSTSPIRTRTIWKQFILFLLDFKTFKIQGQKQLSIGDSIGLALFLFSISACCCCCCPLKYSLNFHFRQEVVFLEYFLYERLKTSN